MKAHPYQKHPIIFYDGTCGVCHGFVQFLLRHDRKRLLRYAPLQGEWARELLEPKVQQTLESMVYYEENRVLQKSQGVAAALRHLHGPWKALGMILRAVPDCIGDRGYQLIAKNRHRWGLQHCRILAPQDRKLFLP